MLRLTLLLLFGMVAALFTLGEDRGQLRPGLARAEAEGRLDDVWAEARARAEPAPIPVSAPVPVAAKAPAEPAPEPAPVAAAPVAMADASSVVVVEAGRDVVTVVEEPVFTLSALGNEPVPGEDGAAIESAVAEAAAEPARPLPSQTGEGTIWYVTADSVNVRAEPSTEADILERLGNGEAALLVAAVDSEWGRIVIQGDGVEGYVALRYLSPTFP